MGLSTEGQGSLGTVPPVSLTSLESWVRGHNCLSPDLSAGDSYTKTIFPWVPLGGMDSSRNIFGQAALESAPKILYPTPPPSPPPPHQTAAPP